MQLSLPIAECELSPFSLFQLEMLKQKTPSKIHIDDDSTANDISVLSPMTLQTPSDQGSKGSTGGVDSELRKLMQGLSREELIAALKGCKSQDDVSASPAAVDAAVTVATPERSPPANVQPSAVAESY